MSARGENLADVPAQMQLEQGVMNEKPIAKRKSMKLAFTTLGCPKWDIATIIAKAKEYGFNGVDFRGYLGEMDLGLFPEFKAGIKALSENFKAASLTVSCISTSIIANTPTQDETRKNLLETEKYCR